MTRFPDASAADFRCAGAADVVAALAYARERSLPVAVRSGGHCFAGRSTSEGGVLIDVRPMSSVVVRGATVVVGAGTSLGELYAALAPFGVTIPAGCGDTVGISGLTLGGGLGILGRTHGLTCDSLRAATVVLASGQVVTCSAEVEPDLFWALRGGGAPGVVTALEFATVPAPECTAFQWMFPPAAAVDVAAAWQAYTATPTLNAVSLVLSTSSDVNREVAVAVFGAAFGSTAGAAADLRRLRQALGAVPLSQVRRPGTYHDAKRWLTDEAEPHNGVEPPGWTYLSSEYFGAAFHPAELVARLLTDRRPGEFRELDFTPWGMAYNAVRPEATAFPHRDELFLLKQAATVPPGAHPTSWLRASTALAHQHGTGRAYPNFPEPGRPDTAYYAANTARLHAIRTAYDPTATFAADRSLVP